MLKSRPWELETVRLGNERQWPFGTGQGPTATPMTGASAPNVDLYWLYAGLN